MEEPIAPAPPSDLPLKVPAPPLDTGLVAPVRHSGPPATAHGRAIALLATVQALIMAAGLLRWKIIALLLGPAGVGMAASLDRVTQVVLTVGSLSLPVLTLRVLSRARATDPGSVRPLVRALLRVSLGATLAVAVITLAVVGVSPGTFPSLTPYFPALILALMTVPFTAGVAVLRSVYAGLGRYRTAAYTTLAGSLALVCATYLATRALGLLGVYAAALGTSILLFGWLRLRALPPPASVERTPAASLRTLATAQAEFAPLAATVYIVTLVTSLLYAIEQYATLHHLGARAAGYLGAAIAVAGALRVVFAEASMQYLMPLISAPGNSQERTEQVGLYLRALAALLLTATLPLVLFPGEVLVLLYSPAFHAAALVFVILLLAECVLVVSDVFRVLFLGAGDGIGFVQTTVPAQVLTVGAVIWAVPRLGLVGTAFVHLLGACLVLASNAVGARIRLGAHLDLRATAAVGYALGALMGGALATHFVPAFAGRAWAAKCLLGAALLAPVVVWTGTRPGGWQVFLPPRRRAPGATGAAPPPLAPYGDS